MLYTQTVAALLAILATVSGARKTPTSYRYGELKNFEEGMVRKDLDLMDRPFVIIPLNEEERAKYGAKAIVVKKPKAMEMHSMRKTHKAKKPKMMKHHGKPRHHHSYNPDSYRYGERISDAHLTPSEISQEIRSLKMRELALKRKAMIKKAKRKALLKRQFEMRMVRPKSSWHNKSYQPQSYRYGTHINGLHRHHHHHHHHSHHHKKRMTCKHHRAPFHHPGHKIHHLKKCYNPPSYRYGRELMDKKRRSHLRKMHMSQPMMNRDGMMLKQITVFRDMPVPKRSIHKLHKRNMLNENIPVMMDLNDDRVKKEVETVVELFKDKHGKIKVAKQNIQVFEMQHNNNLKEAVIKINAHEPNSYVIQGTLHVLAKPGFEENLANRQSLGRFEVNSNEKKKSLGDKFKQVNIPKMPKMPEFNMNQDFKNFAISLGLGVLATIIMVAFGKFLFSLWTRLDDRKRRDDDENKTLLGEEFNGSIHPISVVYKN
jgi:hypothetical protein